MAKGNDEIAAEIVQAVIQARAEVIAGTNNRKEYLQQYLSDSAIAETYKTVVKAVNKPFDAE